MIDAAESLFDGRRDQSEIISSIKTFSGLTRQLLNGMSRFPMILNFCCAKICNPVIFFFFLLSSMKALTYWVYENGFCGFCCRFY